MKILIHKRVHDLFNWDHHACFYSLVKQKKIYCSIPGKPPPGPESLWKNLRQYDVNILLSPSPLSLLTSQHFNIDSVLKLILLHLAYTVCIHLHSPVLATCYMYVFMAYLCFFDTAITICDRIWEKGPLRAFPEFSF